VCDAGGGLLTYGALKVLVPVFTPSPSTPDPQKPQTIREALSPPDANNWRTAMDIIIENMCRYNVFTEVPRPFGRNIVTP